jgi:hypothetical protein
MKYRSLLYQLTEEKTKQEERLGARLRKRKQRSKEQAIRQTNPFQMILVVRNKMNGEILIIDKESYSPQYHEIIMSPDKIDQASIKQILSDPKFVQTETSKRLFGDIKTNKESSKKDKEQESGTSTTSETSGGEEAPPPPSPAPRKEIPFTADKAISGPVIALGMMSGLDNKGLQKLGVSPQDIEDYNSSEEIQNISMEIARSMSAYFKNIVGRDIVEYSPMLISDQMFATSDYWKTMGGFDSKPKSDLIFRHKCVDESNKDKKCKETMCGCLDAGIVPTEQMMSFTFKYGSAPLTSGKLNNDAKTTLYSTINLIDSIAAGQGPKEITSQFREKEKELTKKLVKDIEFLKKIVLDDIKSKVTNPTNYITSNDDKMNALVKIADKLRLQIERVINSNDLYKELFLLESINGFSKFTSASPAYAQGIIAMEPESYRLSMELINLNFSRKVLDQDVKFVLNFKNQIEETPDEKQDLEACKIRFGGKCPKIVNPQKYEIRKLLSSYLKENKFNYSKLNYLIEQTTPEEYEQIFLELVENSNGILELMTLFAIVPVQITIGSINYMSVVSTDYSSERNIIKVNGKTFEIPVQIDPMAPDSTEKIFENSILVSLFERALKRDYKKEYRDYHGTAEQRANRSKRVLARRKLMRAGKVEKGDGKDVDHKDGNPQNNSMSNLRVRSKSENRADNGH